MNFFSMRAPVRALVASLLVMTAMVLSACGDDDPCSGVTCDFGACDSSSGQCLNRDYCETDQDCVPGYECSLEHSCEAVSACSADADCEAGVCKDGACVNPNSCEADADCVAGTYCGPKNKCIADPCNGVTCQRGVCARGTDKCISADSCTPETEQFDCIAGEKCAEGSCQPAETFCDNITCDRGVCDFAAGGCTNAADCAGDDANCAEGYFCNDQNSCQVDLCERDQVDCAGDGVCVPSVGECQNATTCESNGDCLSDHLCVEGTCRLATVACGDASGDGGCPGNQTCEFDETNLTASCTEPATCETSLDCTGDRQCAGQSCADPITCQDDYFEPNNASDEASDFISIADANSVAASLCGGDTDLYSFNTQDLVNSVDRGTLVVELDVAHRDIGLGEATVRLLSDGNEQGSASTGAMGADGMARIEFDIDATNQGDYSVEVAGGSDLNSAGLSYTLSINLLTDETVTACANAIPARLNQRLSGTTDGSESYQLGSSCTSATNASNERIYQFDVENPSEVTIELTPVLTSSNFSMSLRKSCEQASSESACVDATGEGDGETLTQVLDPGTYYLVVQGADGATGGAYTLLIDAINTFCAPQSSYCADADTSMICLGNGGRLASESCASGCNPTTGQCFPPPGDVCYDAESIGQDTIADLNLVQLNNTYEIPSGDCLDGADTQTDGPDQTYQLVIPPHTTAIADVSFANEVQGSLYLIDTCALSVQSCVKGANADSGSEENLFYINDTDQEQVYYLVVDTAAGQPFSTAQLSVAFEDTICAPDATQCNATAVETCNERGTAYTETKDCGNWGCDAGACAYPETCGDALDITTLAAAQGGVTYSERWNVLTNDYTSDYMCPSGDTYSAGEDLVFMATLADQQVLHAVADSDGSTYPSLSVVSNCGDAANTCLAGNDGSTAEVFYSAQGAETVYLMLDSDDWDDDTFTLDMEIVDGCDPNAAPMCDGSGNVTYCQPSGLPASYTCDSAGGCTGGFCDVKNSDYFFDAEDLTTSASATGGTSISQLNDNFTDLIDGQCGMSAAGRDAFYVVTLQSGQTLSTTLNYDSYVWPRLALISAADLTCLDNDSTYGGDATATYTASGTETVFVVADGDVDSTGYTMMLDVEIN